MEIILTKEQYQIRYLYKITRNSQMSVQKVRGRQQRGQICPATGRATKRKVNKVASSGLIALSIFDLLILAAASAGTGAST